MSQFLLNKVFLSQRGSPGRGHTPVSGKMALPGGAAATGVITAFIAVMLSSLPSTAAFGGESSAESAYRQNTRMWEHSIVTLEVARKDYNYLQPWTRQVSRQRKTGIVVGEHEILTTADELFDRTFIRVQKGGRGQWWFGTISWIDYSANLALVTVADSNFWSGLEPASFGSLPPDGSLQILRWKDGNLERRSAEFTQYAVRQAQLSPINHVVLEASSEIQNAGWCEPIVCQSRVVGLVRAQSGRTCIAIPASFIRSILDARQKGQYHGLGYFHFYWQPTENPASLAALNLPGPPRGVIVIEVSPRPDGLPAVLRPNDIILQIDGFDIDIQGDYNDPEYGNIMLENLSTRFKWAGDAVKMKIWRDNKEMEVTYRLPKYKFTNSLVPFATYDQEPQYLIVGGLVFQPLTDSFLQSWGSDWRARAPLRLTHYCDAPPTKKRPALVILSQVLPDPFNLGYEDQRYLVVDKVNGRRVSYLSDLKAALQKPVNGYNIIEFMKGNSLRRMVIGAGEFEREATARVLKRYGIDESFYLASNESR